MNIQKQLKEAYKLLIPITNKILFDKGNQPVKENLGFKLSEGFMSSYTIQKKENKIVVVRMIEVIKNSIFNFNEEQKRQIILIFFDNEVLIQATCITSAFHAEIDTNQFIFTIVSDYLNNNFSNELLLFFNYHLIFIFEFDLSNGYISENDYIEVIKNVTKKTNVI